MNYSLIAYWTSPVLKRYLFLYYIPVFLTTCVDNNKKLCAVVSWTKEIILVSSCLFTVFSTNCIFKTPIGGSGSVRVLNPEHDSRTVRRKGEGRSHPSRNIQSKFLYDSHPCVKYLKFAPYFWTTKEHRVFDLWNTRLWMSISVAQLCVIVLYICVIVLDYGFHKADLQV